MHNMFGSDAQYTDRWFLKSQFNCSEFHLCFPRAYKTEKISCNFAHLNLFAAFGNSVSPMMPPDMFERIMATFRLVSQSIKQKKIVEHLL